MKHIKVKAEVVAPDFQKVKVTILEQTHRGTAFGPSPYRHPTDKNYGIHSACYPEVQDWGRMLAMRGSYSDRDYNTLLIPIEHWPKIKETIEAYNTEFADKTDVCTVTVG